MLIAVMRCSLVLMLVVLGCDGTSPPETLPTAQDPASLPCAGRLAFPGLPTLPGTLRSSGTRVGELNGDGRPDLVVYSDAQLEFALGGGDGTFTVIPASVGGIQLRGFELADLNADGKTDLVASVRTALGTGELQVWLFTGTGFTAAQTLPTSMYPGPVRLADMNHDGKLDLLTASDLATSTEVKILLGNGAGTFALSQTLVGESTAYSIDVVDLNGDGTLDVVTPAYNVFAVWLSSPTGYGAVQEYPAVNGGGGQSGIAIGDVTGDGKADVVVAAAEDMTVFTNTGTGAFTQSLPIAVGNRASVKLVDLDGNGKLDIVFTNEGQFGSTYGAMGVLINQGSGNFSTATMYGFDARTRSLSIVDLDRDGHLDLVAGIGRMVWFRGTGTGAFLPGRRLDLAGETTQGAAIQLADLDGDGRLDLALPTPYGLSVILNEGTANTFPSFAVQMTSDASFSHGVRWTDLDDDGLLDLIATGTTHDSTQGVVSTRLGTGGGAFAGSSATYQPGVSWLGTYYDPDTNPLELTTLADLDGDGRRDLLLLGESGAGTTVQSMLASGDGTLAAAPVSTSGGMGGALVVGDFDGDGILDLIIPDRYVHPPHECGISSVSPCSGTSDVASITGVYYRRGLGDGGFGDARIVWSVAYSPIAAAALDVDSDGKLDLVIAQEGTEAVLIGHGDGTFDAPRYASLIPGEPRILVARDLNADGHQDLLAVSASGAFSALSHGDGTFAFPVAVGRIYGWPAFADFNGDGNLDVVTQRGAVDIMLGRGDGSFDEPLTFLAAGASGRSVSTGDADGDGYVDILVEGAGTDVSILRGSCR